MADIETIDTRNRDVNCLYCLLCLVTLILDLGCSVCVLHRLRKLEKTKIPILTHRLELQRVISVDNNGMCKCICKRIQKKFGTDSAFYEEDAEKYSFATESVTGASESNSGQKDFNAEVVDSDMNHSNREPDSGSDEETYVDYEEETETFYEMEEDETFFDCEEHNINKCKFRESLAAWILNLNLEQ
ncbi:hypothetical protein OUZ56_011320 [Daphnia magna]|uniref:Uncharacterized protein n=1 Tax=Daphnia magna TaxID=35525 RepID=A0ABQ9YZT4_9CRUS|nr:hypothetical protein OUZ56_011320 [Daphnia magna]